MTCNSAQLVEKLSGRQADVGRGAVVRQIHWNPRRPDVERPSHRLSSSQRHLSSKEPRGKCHRKRKKTRNLSVTCTRMHAISNSRCQKARFYFGEGAIMEKSFLAADGLPHRLHRLQEENREIAPTTLEPIQISCKAEMFCLRRAPG